MDKEHYQDKNYDNNSKVSNMHENTILKLKNKIILVTGGAGFIGSHLCEDLLSIGAKVRCLDNFSTGKKDNIAPLLSHDNFQLIEGDICDLATCIKATEGCHAITHHAAQVSVPNSFARPIETVNTNIVGTTNLLVAARKNGVSRFVYATSSSVYGDNDDDLKTETSIGTPLSPYAITKYTKELLAKNLCHLWNMESIGFRYFNVFGPRQDPNGAYAAVIPRFINAILNNQAPEIYGDGNQTRDFIFVKDVVRANLIALATSEKKAYNEVYNIGGELPTSVYSLFKTLDSLISTSKHLSPSYLPMRNGDIYKSCAQISKAKTVLQFSPTISFKDGLSQTVEYYQYGLKR